METFKAPEAMILIFVVTVIFSAGHGHCASPIFNVTEKICSGTQYDLNSTFHANLAILFSSLNNKSLSSSFYNNTVGNGTDGVYGLYFCTGDLPLSDCRNCILTATSDILQLCPTNRQGVVWYDYCELRYSDQNFFGIMDSSGVNLMNPSESLPDPSPPLKIVSQLVEKAPLQRPLMFAFNALEPQSIYALAQCSSDLNSTSCANCLTAVLEKIKACCSQGRGWRYLAVSCWIRYEATPFLRNINTSTEISVSACSKDSFPSSNAGVLNKNLRSLLSSLPSDGSPSGFYNTSIGHNGDAIYSLVLCRPDVKSSTCRSCLNLTSNSILQICSNKTQGTFWYERCMLRYSNQNFFGVVDDYRRFFCGDQETTQEADKAVVGLMSGFVEMAPQQKMMFAAGSVSISDSLSSFGLVQCTRDLDSAGCRKCLTDGLKTVSSSCKQKKGWRYLSRSCTLRYEDFAFFDVSAVPVLVPLVPQSGDHGGKHLKALIMGTIAPIVGMILLGFVLYFMRRRKIKKYSGCEKENLLASSGDLASTGLQLFDIPTIELATDNFSDANKLGEGGFGPVYKGMLPDGKEIAIKRLSSSSTQGSEEFKNEVISIAKLQHRNLVRLLGCCSEGDERILIYEYLPNGSLDTFLLDPEKRSLLDWRIRMDIIVGITRGLIYLHEDSQLKVIHRDLKPSNMLLDLNMNPKISDFGMARIFSNDENEANTNRLVGTYGYMAPEFAMDGLFSAKSDVFSFGVLLLEIVSGQKNGRQHLIQHDQSLLKRAWQLWRGEKTGVD